MKGKEDRARMTVSLPRTLVAQLHYIAVMWDRTLSEAFEIIVTDQLQEEPYASRLRRLKR